MAKSQQKSNRENKKPKKSDADRAKSGPGSAYKQSLSAPSTVPTFGKKK